MFLFELGEFLLQSSPSFIKIRYKKVQQMSIHQAYNGFIKKAGEYRHLEYTWICRTNFHNSNLFPWIEEEEIHRTLILDILNQPHFNHIVRYQ